MIGRVHPRAGVGVLEPGPADVGVLLHDHKRHAGLLEPEGRENAGHARPDDDDFEGAIGIQLVFRPLRSARVTVGERQLLDQERDVLLGGWRAGEEVEHRAQVGLGRRRRDLATAAAEGGEYFECEGSRPFLLLFRPAPLLAGEKARIRHQVIAQ